MKFVVGLVLLWGMSSANADFGTQLQLKVDPQGGPSFGVQYFYDSDRAWTFNFATSLSSDHLATLPQSLVVNFADSDTGTYLGSWQPIDKNFLIVGTVGVTSSASDFQGVLTGQSHLLVVFGLPGAGSSVAGLYYLDVGGLCKQAPNHFVDGTMGKTGCTVTAADVAANDPCLASAKDLLNLVKQGLITCSEANGQYQKQSCGPLSCP